MAGSPSPHPVRTWLVLAIALVVVGWALRATGPVVVPLVFSVFLALVIAPVDAWVAGRLPRPLAWIGHLAAMSLGLGTILLTVAAIWVAANQVLQAMQALNPDAMLEWAPDLSTDATEGGSGLMAEIRRGIRQASGGLTQQLQGFASGIAMTVIGRAGAAVTSTVLVFFMTLLMLIEGPNWRAKLVSLTHADQRDHAMHSISTIARKLRAYLAARAALGLLTAAIYAGWLWLFDLDLILTWALLTFLFNFIPTFGSLISGVLPILYALLTKDAGTAVLIGAGIFLIEQVMGNYADPKVQGRQVSISPLVILVVLLIWGWMWGIAGAVLAVPITISVMIVSAHVGPMRNFALLLSDRRDLDALDDMLGID